MGLSLSTVKSSSEMMTMEVRHRLVLFLYVFINLVNTIYTQNLALYKFTLQSSTADDIGVSGKAVDGSTAAEYERGSCIHTGLNDITPWWMVDLGRNYDVKKVVLWNRAGKGHEWRLYQAMIKVTPEAPHPGMTADDLNSFTSCAQNMETPKPKHTLWCQPGAKGRYVYIHLPPGTRRNFLNFCEVQVYGNADTFYTNNGYSKHWCATTNQWKGDQKQSICDANDKPRENTPPPGTINGNSDGEPCKFPFTYNGKEYSSCIRTNYFALWCATTGNYDRDRKWGECYNTKCG